MPDTLSRERLSELRERHAGSHTCVVGTRWYTYDTRHPCDTAQALAHIDALTAETRAVCAAWLAQDDKGLDGAMADLCATMGMEP
jgi:hypothetical protein